MYLLLLGAFVNLGFASYFDENESEYATKSDITFAKIIGIVSILIFILVLYNGAV